jgi:hypothetical protein
MKLIILRFASNCGTSNKEDYFLFAVGVGIEPVVGAER